MQHAIILSILLLTSLAVSAQRVDSIYFNLYTDSLKKGTYNYINVEGRYTDGHYQPLGDKELTFSASGGSFSGNNLFIDASFPADKVTVSVNLKANPSLKKVIFIYIKKTIETERLPTVEEILRKPR